MAKYLQILESLAACVSLLVCSSTLVIINKWVMTDLEFRYPQVGISFCRGAEYTCSSFSHPKTKGAAFLAVLCVQFVGALGMAFVSIVSFVYCTVLGKVQPVPEVTWGYW